MFSGLVGNPNKCIILLIPNPHRSGEYELSEAEGVQRGTKIVIHLKGECYDYCKEEVIKGELLLKAIWKSQGLPESNNAAYLSHQDEEETPQNKRHKISN